MMGLPQGNPSLFMLTFLGPKKCKQYVSSSAKTGSGSGVFWRTYEAGSKAVWMAATTALPPRRDASISACMGSVVAPLVPT